MASRLDPDGSVPSIVLIGVPHQRALERVLKKLQGLSIGHQSFIEPDFDMGLSAVATVPLAPEQREHLMKYEPWKEHHNALGK